jgi:hypothetical protein
MAVDSRSCELPWLWTTMVVDGHGCGQPWLWTAKAVDAKVPKIKI